MKTRRILLFLLVVAMLFTASCRQAPGGDDGSTDPGEPVQPEQRQYMAYHFGNAARVGDDLYFVSGTSFSKAQIFASEYGAADFEPFVPCFDAVCNHSDRTKCCISTSKLKSIYQIAAFSHEAEPSLILFNPVDICFSKPYSNTKIFLKYEEVVNYETPTNESDVVTMLETLQAIPRRSELLVYDNYLYYTEIKNGIQTQYRISLDGGKPERVFKEENIIIRTIINNRFYGIRYDVDSDTTLDIKDMESIHYFRSDMNYENIEPLPELLTFFALAGDTNFVAGGKAILDADEDHIYITGDKKVWAIPDSDIYAKPILLSDIGDEIPNRISSDLRHTAYYKEGSIYAVVNTDRCYRSLLNSTGLSAPPTTWYNNSSFFSFDIRTGECRTLDISNSNHLISSITYADGKYVYAEGIYVHDDNRVMQGVTMRLTLDTMRYEVILPDRFWEYSAEITGD